MQASAGIIPALSVLLVPGQDGSSAKVSGASGYLAWSTRLYITSSSHRSNHVARARSGTAAETDQLESHPSL